MAQRLKHLPASRRPGFDPWVGKIPWRRKWQPTPVFLPGESHGWRNLVGYSPRGHKESELEQSLASAFPWQMSLTCILFLKSGLVWKDVIGFSSFPQLDGTHFISLYGILSSWLTDSVSLLPPSFWIFQTLRGKSGFSILPVIQDDGVGVSSTKLPTRLASSRR